MARFTQRFANVFKRRATGRARRLEQPQPANFRVPSQRTSAPRVSPGKPSGSTKPSRKHTRPPSNRSGNPKSHGAKRRARRLESQRRNMAVQQKRRARR